MSVNSTRVQSTNDVSIVSKCSTAMKNYFRDDYVRYFVEKEKTRASLIHLGYYARAVLFSEVLLRLIQFMKLHKILKFQIISCGAGFDTTYWRLTEEGLLGDSGVFVEIDYPSVVDRKVSLIRQSEKLLSLLGESSPGQMGPRLSDNYFILGADLRDVGAVEGLLTKVGIDFDSPTLFLSECVITYMKEEDSSALLRWMSHRFPTSALIIYEQIHPEDGFGQVMLRHFDKLQSSLLSIAKYPDCKSHRNRYQSLGFQSSVVMSEWDFLSHITTPEERERVLCLEQFDEFEEFHLKCVHYVFAVAANGLFTSWTEQRTEPDDFSVERKRLAIEQTDVRLEVFGHTTCSLGDGQVLILGGFTPKGRSKGVVRFDGHSVVDVEVTGSCAVRLEGIHGSALAFRASGRTYIGMFGGRTAPNKPCNDGDFMIMELTKDGKLASRFVVPGDTGPCPRYRAAVACRASGKNISVWVFGGRTRDLRKDLPELWQLELREEKEEETFKFEWKCKERKGAWPGSRMSCGVAVCNDREAMYLTCGLDARSFVALNDVWKWSFGEETWSEMRVASGQMIPRYGHTSHIRGSKLYLIGGVNTFAGLQPGVAVLDLETLHVVEYAMESFFIEPILLFNHGSEVSEEEEGFIRVFGGGGNCFSFGTHFNANVSVIRLKQFEE